MYMGAYAKFYMAIVYMCLFLFIIYLHITPAMNIALNADRQLKLKQLTTLDFLLILRSIYRQILFLSLVALGRENIDVGE